MATSGRSAAQSGVPIIGIPLDEADLKAIPQQELFRYSSVRRSPFRSVTDVVMDIITFKRAAPPERPYRCPSCKPSDPDVTVPVINACSRGAAPVVSVECVNGHWASYPCPAR